MGLGFRVWGGFRIWGLAGFRACSFQGLGCSGLGALGAWG